MANKLLKTLNFGGEDTYHIGWESLQNPPFGVDYANGVTLIDNETVSFVEAMGGYALSAFLRLGAVYRININGVENEVTSKTMNMMGMEIVCIGNRSLINGMLGTSYEDTGENFLNYSMVGMASVIIFNDGRTNDITLSLSEYNIKKLDEAYYNAPSIYMTTYYLNSTENNTIMYNSPTFENAVTKDELNVALGKGIVRLFYIMDGETYFYPSCFMVGIGRYSSAYVQVGSATILFHTAEYNG